jgi:hypothetical protein
MIENGTLYRGRYPQTSSRGRSRPETVFYGDGRTENFADAEAGGLVRFPLTQGVVNHATATALLLCRDPSCLRSSACAGEGCAVTYKARDSVRRYLPPSLRQALSSLMSSSNWSLDSSDKAPRDRGAFDLPAPNALEASCPFCIFSSSCSGS